MTHGRVDQSKVIAVNNLQEFFRDAVDSAIDSQNLTVTHHTAHYVVNLLTLYSRSEHFYELTDDGVAIKPLAMMLDDALSSETDTEREARYRRLGDVALFVAGFFARSFARRPVDVDYYIAMGGNAYGTLSSTLRGSSRPHVFCDIFDELSDKFQPLVDVLNEIADGARALSDRDLMRLYDTWRRTGSARAARILREHGVTLFGQPRDARWRLQ
ncbi:MAG: hypothetical protein AAFU65_04460 [Pseudomonadota bacterium]